MSVPTNTVSANGSGVVTDDQLNTFVQACDTASNLRNFTGNQNMCVLLMGITAVNDGNGGFFYWNTGTYTDNNSTVIVPNSSSTGAWIKLGAL